jgi:hypothetical protein
MSEWSLMRGRQKNGRAEGTYLRNAYFRLTPAHMSLNTNIQTQTKIAESSISVGNIKTRRKLWRHMAIE